MTIDFRAIGRELSDRGRWGPDDERGMLNLVTPAHAAAAADPARTGRVFDLGHTPARGAPRLAIDALDAACAGPGVEARDRGSVLKVVNGVGTPLNPLAVK